MKQYLLIVDELGMAELEKQMGPNIKFLPVEGMNVNNKHQALMTPILPILDTVQPDQPVAQPEAQDAV